MSNNIDAELLKDPLDAQVRNALSVCNFNLSERVKNAIKANIVNRVELYIPQKEAFSVAKLGEDMIITDNRELKIIKANNIIEKLTNFVYNITILIKEKYGIV